MRFGFHLKRNLLAALSIIFCGSIYAQTPTLIEFPFDVTTAVMEKSQAVEQRIAMDLLADVVESRGGHRDENEGWLFLVGISSPVNSDQLALSVVTLYRLPEPVVQLGKESEAFYMMMSESKRRGFDPEGKHMREYVSEEYMRQFSDVQGHYVEMVSKSELQEALEEIVDKFLNQHIKPVGE